MELNEAEDQVFNRLNAPTNVSEAHRRALAHKTPSKLSDYSYLGIDTNILKRLRRNLTLADDLREKLAQSDVHLIIPRQCIVEYWNNYQVFQREDFTSLRNDLNAIKKRIENDAIGGRESELISQIDTLFEQLTDGIEDVKAPQYLAHSQKLIEVLLERGSAPMVSRMRFSKFASVRTDTKTPPGFADDKHKASSLGDFFVWCDFMLGVVSLPSRSDKVAEAAWITEDSKPDWKTGGSGHPTLFEEFTTVCDANLNVLSFSDLTKLVRDVDESAKRARRAKEAQLSTDTEEHSSGALETVPPDPAA